MEFITRLFWMFAIFFISFCLRKERLRFYQSIFTWYLSVIQCYILYPRMEETIRNHIKIKFKNINNLNLYNFFTGIEKMRNFWSEMKFVDLHSTRKFFCVGFLCKLFIAKKPVRMAVFLRKWEISHVYSSCLFITAVKISNLLFFFSLVFFFLRIHF